MSFRKVGGVQYSATQNIVKNRYNTSDNLYVTQNVGEPNTYINFLSDISGNQIYGDLDVSGNLHVSGNIDCSGNINVDGDVTAEAMFLSSGNDFSNYVSNSVVTKSYIDTFTSGIAPLPSCVLCSNVATISLSGTSQTIDGISSSTYIGSYILVNAQGGVNVPDIDNGIYVISSGLWSRASFLDGTDTAYATATSILDGNIYKNYNNFHLRI